jgi:tellurite resistance protein TehA-like permease
MLGVLYGVPVWGFAVLWTAIAATITVRTARRHLPFSLTWWSFTFPVGTCVTATTWYAALVLAWLTVALRTAHGAARGRLLLPPPAQPAHTSQ